MAALYTELRSLTRFAAELDGILSRVDEADAEARRHLGSNYAGLLEAWDDALAQIRSKCFALGFVTARITIEVEAGTWTPDGGSSE